jgi:hypothetical protein
MITAVVLANLLVGTAKELYAESISVRDRY